MPAPDQTIEATEPASRVARRFDAPGAGSLARMLEVLDLFSVDRPVLRVDDLQATLGYTKSTAYRYVKTLCDAGLLAQGAQGRYTLGPRVIELERLMRIADPLLQAGEAVLPALAAQQTNSMVLLCTLYRDKVLCVHREGPEAIESDGHSIRILRARGVPLPLFQGAASLAILGHLPTPRIRALFTARRTEMAAAGLGEDWRAVRERLAGIRRDGHVATAGRFNQHLAAVSVPVLSRDGSQVYGSLTRIMALGDYQPEHHGWIVTTLQIGARQLSARLA